MKAHTYLFLFYYLRIMNLLFVTVAFIIFVFYVLIYYLYLSSPLF